MTKPGGSHTDHDFKGSGLGKDHILDRQGLADCAHYGSFHLHLFAERPRTLSG
jgi:hypothetical protein